MSRRVAMYSKSTKENSKSEALRSVNFLNGWATATTGSSSKIATTWHAAAHVRTGATTSGLVDFHHDWIHNTLKLLLLGLELILLSQLILVKPIKSVLDSLLNVVLVTSLELVLELLLLQCVAHGEAVILETVLGFDFGLVGLIFRSVLL